MTSQEIKEYHDTTDGSVYTDMDEVEQKIQETGHQFRVVVVQRDPDVKLVTPKDNPTQLDQMQAVIDKLNARLAKLEGTQSGVKVNSKAVA